MKHNVVLHGSQLSIDSSHVETTILGRNLRVENAIDEGDHGRIVRITFFCFLLRIFFDGDEQGKIKSKLLGREMNLEFENSFAIQACPNKNNTIPLCFFVEFMFSFWIFFNQTFN